MGTSSKELERKLRALASRQHGCFTAAQAIKTGYADSVHLYHVKNGHWIRMGRGIYRFSDVEETPASRCMAALLWTRNKSGIIDGIIAAETAQKLVQGTLSIQEQIHVLVPKTFRRSTDVPPHIVIHKVDTRTIPTSKILGMECEATGESSGEQGKPPLDLPDYYDWIDYQEVLGAK